MIQFLGMVDATGKNAAPIADVAASTSAEVVAQGMSPDPNDFGSLVTRNATEASLASPVASWTAVKVANPTADISNSDDLVSPSGAFERFNFGKTNRVAPLVASLASPDARGQETASSTQRQSTAAIRTPQLGIKEIDKADGLAATPQIPSDPVVAARTGLPNSEGADYPVRMRQSIVQTVSAREIRAMGTQKPFSDNPTDKGAVSSVAVPLASARVSEPQVREESQLKIEIAGPVRPRISEKVTPIAASKPADTSAIPPLASNGTPTSGLSDAVVTDPSKPIVSRELPEALAVGQIKRDAPKASNLGAGAPPKVASPPPFVEQSDTINASTVQSRLEQTHTVAGTNMPKPADTMEQPVASRVFINGKEYQSAVPTPDTASSPKPRADNEGEVSPTNRRQTNRAETGVAKVMPTPLSPTYLEKGAVLEGSLSPREQPQSPQMPSQPAVEISPRSHRGADTVQVKPLATGISIQDKVLMPPTIDGSEPRTHISPHLIPEGMEADRSAIAEGQKATTSNAHPPRGEIARSVAQQMAAAVGQATDGTIDVRLHPEDLGRVRLALTPGDMGLAVTITAERPDTLELVRRHIDMLAQDLRQNGFQNLAFSFGQNERDTGPLFRPPDGVLSPIDEPIAETSKVPQKPLPSTGQLDIRL